MKKKDLIIIEGLEKLRIARNLSQKDLVKGIMTPATYSRAKQNKATLNFYTINLLCERLEARLEDIIDFSNFDNDQEILNLKREYDYVVEHQGSIKRAEALYKKLTKRELLTNDLERHLVLLKKYYAANSEIIEPITQKYIDTQFHKIVNSEVLTSYDLEFLADFTGYFTMDQLKHLVPRILEIKTDIREFHNLHYHKNTGICFVNFADMFIDHLDFDIADKLIKRIEEYATKFGYADYTIWANYLKQVADIYKIKNYDKKKKNLAQLEEYLIHIKKVLPNTRINEFFQATFSRLKERNGFPPITGEIYYLLKG